MPEIYIMDNPYAAPKSAVEEVTEDQYRIRAENYEKHKRAFNIYLIINIILSILIIYGITQISISAASTFILLAPILLYMLAKLLTEYFSYKVAARLLAKSRSI